jgi:hypothetical protein
MVKRSVPTRKDHGDAIGHPRGGKKVSTLGLALRRRDALALLVTGLLLGLLALSAVDPGGPRRAQPTGAAGGAAAPDGRCDLGAPCATGVAAAALAG